MSTRKIKTGKIKNEMIRRALEAGRVNGSHAIMFQQSVGQKLGLGATDMKCLDFIYQSAPVNPTQLAEFAGLTTGAVTILIDRLENAKLIERKPDPNDRRRTALAPTPEAMKKVPPYYEGLASGMAKLASEFSEAELKILERFFQRTTAVFKNETAKLREDKR